MVHSRDPAAITFNANKLGTENKSQMQLIDSNRQNWNWRGYSLTTPNQFWDEQMPVDATLLKQTGHIKQIFS
jgi:hypothetical protein